LINLDNINLINIAPTYLSYMKDRVLNKINNLPYSLINPFTFLSVLNNNGCNTEEFIEDLLSKDIEELCFKYPEINNYLLSCKFVFYSDFSVDKELKRASLKCNMQNRSNYRREYVNKYSNQWINTVLTNHSNYYLNDNNFKLLVNEIKNKIYLLNQMIEEILNYDLIEQDERHALLFKFDVEVCPYCNRNYISKFEKDGKLKTTADLDHFYPKSKFTLFSLSLHNFVPSCQICNSRFKMAKGVEIMNPYSDKINYNQFKFSCNLNVDSDASIFFDENTNFDIGIECKNERYKNNIELFELENLYNTHKPLVAEIFYKKESYNGSYQNLFNNLFNGMNLSEAEIYIFLYGINMDERTFYKKPLSKLIYDIVNDN